MCSRTERYLLIISTVLVVLGSLTANAQRGIPRDGRPGCKWGDPQCNGSDGSNNGGWTPGGDSVGPAPYPGTPYPPRGGVEREEVYVGRMIENTRGDLLRILGGRGQGRQIEAVVLFVQQPVQGEVILLANGYEVDRNRMAGPMGRMPVRALRPMTLGRDRIELAVNGRLYVERVVVRFAAGWGGGGDGGGHYPDPGYGQRIELPVYVNQMFFPGQLVSVDRMVNLQAYRGHRIDGLRMMAQSLDRPQAMAWVFVNGNRVGQLIISGGITNELFLNEMIDGYDRIELQFDGRVRLDQVVLRLSRF